MTHDTYQILVVENSDILRKQYVTALQYSGFEVDDAGDLKSALRQIDIKLYDVVLVDLMLNDPIDRSLNGLSLIETIIEADEGTRVIVISGQDSPSAAAEAMKQYGANVYLEKKVLMEKGSRHLLDIISSEIKASERKLLGHFSSIISLFAGDDYESGHESIIWADRIMRTMHSEGGATGLETFLLKLCEPYLPLIPHKDANPPIKLDQITRTARGLFWSKGQGFPIELIICSADQKNEIIQSKKLENRIIDPDISIEMHHLKGIFLYPENDHEREEFEKLYIK